MELLCLSRTEFLSLFDRTGSLIASILENFFVSSSLAKSLFAEVVDFLSGLCFFFSKVVIDLLKPSKNEFCGDLGSNLVVTLLARIVFCGKIGLEGYILPYSSGFSFLSVNDCF